MCNLSRDKNVYVEQNRQYQLIEKAIRFLRENYASNPDLAAAANHINLSEYHFQRLFSQWVGVSPKRFMQYLTKEHAKQVLLTSQSVLDAALDVGLSGAGRLHDLMVSCEAVTPGELKSLGKGLLIQVGYALSPLGGVFIGWTQRGICHLEFCGQPEQGEEQLKRLWPEAEFSRDDAQAAEYVQRIFSSGRSRQPFHLLLRGTNFQIKVWEALLNVPEGQLVSYKQVAEMIEMPKASRAVGSAVAANSIGVLIPCHRVIRESGEFGQYRWGGDRKASLIGWEAAKTDLPVIE